MPPTAAAGPEVVQPLPAQPRAFVKHGRVADRDDSALAEADRDRSLFAGSPMAQESRSPLLCAHGAPPLQRHVLAAQALHRRVGVKSDRGPRIPMDEIGVGLGLARCVARREELDAEAPRDRAHRHLIGRSAGVALEHAGRRGKQQPASAADKLNDRVHLVLAVRGQAVARDHQHVIQRKRLSAQARAAVGRMILIVGLEADQVPRGLNVPRTVHEYSHWRPLSASGVMSIWHRLLRLACPC